MRSKWSDYQELTKFCNIILVSSSDLKDIHVFNWYVGTWEMWIGRQVDRQIYEEYTIV